MPDLNEKNQVISPHNEQVYKLESEAGVKLSQLTALIIRDEGERNRPYLDTKNKVTIGVGRSLSTNGISINELIAILPSPDFHYILSATHIRDSRIYIAKLGVAKKIFDKPLSEHDIALLLTDDLKTVALQALDVFGDKWAQIDEPRKQAIVDTIFNLGLPHFKEFEKFIANIKLSDWKTASNELLLSEAARSHIIRYHRNASVIRTGDPKFFELNLAD